MVGARFAELMGRGGGAPPLGEAALSISAAIQGAAVTDDRLDAWLAEWLAALDGLAETCPSSTPDGLVSHLFRTELFAGNRSAYYDWRNSCLDRVIATHTGIPISLSVLMIEVGRRVGVDLVGVGMPAHFLVRDAGDPDVFFDPFDAGRRLDRRGARMLFEDVTGGQVAWEERFLDPTPNRDIVIRMLNNLKGVFGGRGDAVRLGIVMDLRAAVPELAVLEADEIVASSAVFN
jgi:regulator of sirC expression with transglutaminase-like and TPR domain